MLEEHVNQLPQHVVRGNVHFLNHSRVVGMSYHDVVGRLQRRDAAAIAADQRDREHTQLPGGRQSTHPASAVANRRDAQRNIAGRGEVTQQVREDLVEAFRAGNSGYRRDLSGQRDRWQRPLAHHYRVDELDHDVLGVRARCAVAEDDKGSSTVEPNGHGVACGGDGPGVLGQLI